MSQQYIDAETGLAFLSLDGQLPPGARPVGTLANAGVSGSLDLAGDCAEDPPVAPAAAASPANARGTYGPAGPATDAEELYRSYQALPVQERARFWLFLNDGEQGFTLGELRVLKRRLEEARVDITDRDAYDQAYRRLEEKLTGFGSDPANSSTESAAAAAPARPAFARRGKLLGARVSR